MAYNMEQTFRWYGPKDPVSLEFVRQTGATGVVSSLHHIPYGEVWSVEEIEKYKKVIEDAGLVWSVVESLPVHEDIKTGSGRCEEYIANYKESLRNLGKCGVKVITYNFMPVLDWIRTDLHYRLPDGSEALYFNQAQFAAFEIFILKRAGAEKDYTPEKVAEAKAFYESLTPEELQKFTTGLIDNFPGFKGVTLEDVRAMLKKYEHLTRADLEANLKHFLSEVCPVAEEAGCIMVIHPDDPPYSILGLPRIFSDINDVKICSRWSTAPRTASASARAASAAASTTTSSRCSRRAPTGSVSYTCAARSMTARATSSKPTTSKAWSICTDWSRRSSRSRSAARRRDAPTGVCRSGRTTVTPCSTTSPSPPARIRVTPRSAA